MSETISGKIIDAGPEGLDHPCPVQRLAALLCFADMRTYRCFYATGGN